jgi:ribosomal protein S18 acetylase RimI-like enzyme
MADLHNVRIRPMTAADISPLRHMDANYESPAYLDLVKEMDGLNVAWRLVERPLQPPFVRTNFDFSDQERREIRRRFETGDGLWLVAETVGAEGGPQSSGKLVGVVDVRRESWREAGFVWNLAVDRAYRRQGLGSELMQRVVAWGRRENLRAIILETQSNNWYACRFYQHFGFVPSGIDDHYYSNQDVAKKEIALFWTYEL